MSNTERTEVNVAADVATHSRRKIGAETRIRQLVQQAKRDRERLAQLERELSERNTANAEESQRLRSERVRTARDKGRSWFSDFDAVIAGIPIDEAGFDALLASANGPSIMYAAGLGFRAMKVWDQMNALEQSAQERHEYYRRLHEQHFPR